MPVFPALMRGWILIQEVATWPHSEIYYLKLSSIGIEEVMKSGGIKRDLIYQENDRSAAD